MHLIRVQPTSRGGLLSSYRTYATYTLHLWQLRRTYATYTLHLWQLRRTYATYTLHSWQLRRTYATYTLHSWQLRRTYATYTLHSWQLRRTYATYMLHSWQLRRTYATYMLQTKSLCQDVCHIYVTCRMHAILQRYVLTYPLFGRCFKLPSLSLSTVVHLTMAEYHNNSYSQEKMRRC